MRTAFFTFAGLALLLARGVCEAQSAPPQQGWFPFSISGLDDTATDIDLSRLNDAPAGKAGFVRVQGEHFLDGAGRPLRWLGVNIVATACFPPKDRAPAIAGHLAKMGVNIVRFHFLDNMWGGESLLKKPDYREFDPDTLERWDFFVSELKKRGIYSNINLHVGRVYPGSPKDGPQFSKGLDNFHPPFVQMLKDYCRDLLRHRNPHTGLQYAQEPAVGCIEINNENSLVLNPGWLFTMPEPFAGELAAQWNAWLRKKAASTAALQKELGVDDGSAGPNLITNPHFERNHEGWRTDTPDGPDSQLESLAADKAARWTVKRPGPQDWSHQLSFDGMDLKSGGRYRVRFDARSREARDLHVSVMQGVPEWKNCGLSERFHAGADWTPVELHFHAVDVIPGKVRLTLSARNQTGVFDVRNVRLEAVSDGYLRPGETLEKANIPLPQLDSSLAARKRLFEFLADVEIGYATDIREHLRRDLGVQCPISYSQVLFGGILGARRERKAGDFVDTHGYWQHPHFPNKPWDMNDWEIGNADQMRSAEGGTLAEMAAQRPEGKPYTVSEYDIPAPSDFAAQTWPLLASMACVQDWSGFYIYNYCDSASHWDADKITGFFSTLGHPAKHALMPWAALVFRKGYFPPARTVVALDVGEAFALADAAQHRGDLWGSWRRIWNLERLPAPFGEIAWNHRLSIRFSESGAAPSAPSLPVKSPGIVVRDAGEGLFAMVSEKAFCFAGNWRGALPSGVSAAAIWKNALPGAPSLEGDGPAVLAGVVLDDKPLLQSQKLFVVALRRAENQNMGWRAGRKSVGTAWGSGPALVEGITGRLPLPVGDPWTIRAADPSGKAGRILAEKASELRLSPEAASVWFVLTRN